MLVHGFITRIGTDKSTYKSRHTSVSAADPLENNIREPYYFHHYC